MDEALGSDCGECQSALSEGQENELWKLEMEPSESVPEEAMLFDDIVRLVGQENAVHGDVSKTT